MIEINYVSGAAIVNRPIYVGDGYPLLPDFEDLKKKNDEDSMEDDSLISGLKEPSIGSPLSQKRQFMMKLLN